jgi:anti-sigma factor RsiW
VKLNFRRKLTPFLCQERLYEYATGTLNPQRRADMDEFLATDKTSQEALQAMRRGLDYADKLSSARLSPELVEKLGDSENIRSLIRRYMDWDEWPETFRWSITALTISVMVAGMVTIVPWKKLPSFSKKPHARTNTVILADIPGTVGDAGAEGPDSEADVSQFANDTETSGDEHMAPGEHEHEYEAAVVAAMPRPAVQPTATPKPTPKLVVATPPTPSAPIIATPAASGASSVLSSDPSSDVNVEISNASSASREAKPKGFVFRAFMNLSNVEEVTLDVVAQLESFGAEKAGDVALGWRRGTGSYFHFTLPDSNEDQVLEILRGYGPVRISKDPHPRVMPSGQIRFILWIEPATNN